jgi:hypothetical protein
MSLCLLTVSDRTKCSGRASVTFPIQPCSDDYDFSDDTFNSQSDTTEQMEFMLVY